MKAKKNFSKKPINRYITFCYKEWEGKHPYGTITNILGSVDDLANFYEYQLFCKSLNVSIQGFTKATSKAVKKFSEKEYIVYIQKKYPTIKDRTKYDILTIDPLQSQDFDDGMGIRQDGAKTIISVYITNVPLWMEVLNLWESFSERISTIYLPDRRRPMLPSVLSDCLCSLQENELRVGFCMDAIIENNKIMDIQFCNALIKVTKNYTYEEDALDDNEDYGKLLSITKELAKERKYLDNIRNSHDLVAYLMIWMNHECAKKMVEHEDGIYRTLQLKDTIEIPDNLPLEIRKFIKIWNCAGGQYTNFKDRRSHDLISHGIENYIHITSPIRRLVDLLNMLKIQQSLNLIQFESDANAFYKKWALKLDYINTTMRAIRKVQCDCSLLNLCFTEPQLLDEKYRGYVFDKIQRSDKLFQYMVYLPELKITSRLVLRDEMENYEDAVFQIYTFTDETTLKRKIRLQMIGQK